MKKYNISDLYYSIISPNRKERNNYLSNKVLTIKIILLYFKKVSELVLTGYEYDFNFIVKNKKVNFGSIFIVKKRLGKKKPMISRAETVCNRKMTLSYNPKTVGFYYEIVYKWDLLDRYNMKFKAGGKFRRQLFENLYYKDKDYLLKE